jgi:MFS family permease
MSDTVTSEAASDVVRRGAREVGLISAVLIVAVALIVEALVGPTAATGAVPIFALLCLPAQIVLASVWSHRAGTALSERPRAVRGGILLAATLVIGIVADIVFENTVGDGRGFNTPQIAMFSIVGVVTAFWLAIVLEGWPFVLIPNRIIATAALLVGVWAVALVLYYVLFSFSFLPVRAPHTPAGLFNAWDALVFLVTAITGMFLPPAFGFLVFERMQQPLRGLAWTALCLVWGTLLFGVGVGLAGANVVNFLVWVPVPLLFGGLIILVVFRDSLFGGEPRRLVRGIITTLASAALGVLLVAVYDGVSHLVSPSLAWGPPPYQAQVWIASATLGFTFPLLATHADFFDHWPLRARAEVRVGTAAEELPGI